MCEISVPKARKMTMIQSRCMVVKGLWWTRTH